MVLILNIKSSITLKNGGGNKRPCILSHHLLLGYRFINIEKKDKREKKNPLIYKTDCSLIDFLLNIDERAILSNSWMRDFAPVDKKKSRNMMPEQYWKNRENKRGEIDEAVNATW